MAVIQEIVDGKCVVRIHDDYVETDPEKVQEIVDRVSQLIIGCKMRQARETMKSNIPPEEVKEG